MLLNRTRRVDERHGARALAALAALGLLVAACGGGGAAKAGGAKAGAAAPAKATAGASHTKLSVVAYSVAKAAYDQLQPAFAETDAGKGVKWQSSYGASGDQSRAVANGLAADYVAFSLAPDVTRLVDAGLVAADWDQTPTRGMVSDSVVVFVVRDRNPKNIQKWDDLTRPGVSIVTPNPGSSGSARWNILGAYAQSIATGHSDDEAVDYLRRFFANVVAQPASGREATSAFANGTGDVLLSYENEVILARQSGEKLSYVVPDHTFLIENPVAVTTNAPPAAAAFRDYATSPAGQAILAGKGYRPVVSGVDVGPVKGANDPENPFPAVQATTIADLGGWSAVNKKFFADGGIVPKAQADAGRSG